MFREYMLTVQRDSSFTGCSFRVYLYFLRSCFKPHCVSHGSRNGSSCQRHRGNRLPCERVCQSGIMKHQDFRRAIQSFIRYKTLRFVLEIRASSYRPRRTSRAFAYCYCQRFPNFSYDATLNASSPILMELGWKLVDQRSRKIKDVKENAYVK